MTEQTIHEYDEITYCEVHPDRETALRCNKCDRLMCTQCVVQTPVGYRCRECVRQHEDTFYRAANADYAIGFAVAAGLSMVAGFIMAAINAQVTFIILALIVGFPAGAAVAGAAMRAVQGRRGRRTTEIVTAGTVIGGFLGAALYALMNYPSEWEQVNQLLAARGLPLRYPTLTEFVVRNSITDIAILIFVGMMALAVYNRIKS